MEYIYRGLYSCIKQLYCIRDYRMKNIGKTCKTGIVRET